MFIYCSTIYKTFHCKNMNYRQDIKKQRFDFMNFVFIFALFFCLFSCNKEGKTSVLILVKDANDLPVNNAVVRLYSVSNGSSQALPLIELSAETNANGNAMFDLSGFYNLGQTGFGILYISAEKNGLFTQEYIEVIEEQSNEKILFL